MMTSAAQAQVGCWNETQTAAAKVRNLQNRLLVATQLCAMTGRDISSTYNEFVRLNRATLQGANGVLRAQFADAFGRDAERHYDAFVTSQVNAFGSTHTDGETCLAAEEAAAEGAAAQGEIETLLDLHDRIVDRPELPGGRCRITFTRAAAKAAPAAITVKIEKVEEDREDEGAADARLPDIDRTAVTEVFSGGAAVAVADGGDSGDAGADIYIQVPARRKAAGEGEPVRQP